MRKLILFAAMAAIVVCGFYAAQVGRAAKARHGDGVAASPIAAAPVADERPAPPFVPYRGPAFKPEKQYPPGTYLPRGFAADFRERIVKDFNAAIDARLGDAATPEQRKAAAAVQNAFWDEHGPNVDLFRDGKISQPEFAERTHLATLHFAQGMAKIFDDPLYVKLFDVPKDVDPYYQLFHSNEEQPGLPMKEAVASSHGASPPQRAPTAPESAEPFTPAPGAPPDTPERPRGHR